MTEAREVGKTRHRRTRSATATRNQILDVALRLFRERGYDATGTRDIAAAAAVAEGTIFYHFGSKAGLLDVLGRTFMDEMITMLGAGQTRPSDVGCRGLIERTFEYAERFGLRHQRLGLPLDSPALKHFWEVDRQVVVTFLIDVLTDWHDKGLIRADMNIPVAAELVHAMVRDAILIVFTGGRAGAADAYLDETVKLVSAAIGYRESD